jgi:hypothetical protein
MGRKISMLTRSQMIFPRQTVESGHAKMARLGLLDHSSINQNQKPGPLPLIV